MENQENPIRFIYNKNQKANPRQIPQSLNEDKNKGPYTYDQLMKESLQRSTPIWFKGLEYWVEAEELVFFYKNILKKYPLLIKSSVLKKAKLVL